MRLFIAILLNDQMKNALLQMQDDMRERGVQGNFTPEENMHLTVAFIGDYPDPQDVLDVIEESAFRPVDLRHYGIGSFGELWYAGLQENKALYAYVKRLRHGLADAGIPFDRKRFTPHITLIRKPLYRHTEDIAGIELPKASMIADHISLMRSDRGKHGMIYTEIGWIGGE
jgi:2'-5' RNA ligase